MFTVAALVTGLVIGSFLNVCIYRLPEKKSLLFPGSHCPQCTKPIPFYHNIPVLSFIILKGRCSNCSAKISWQYPFVEVISALVTLGAFSIFGLTGELFFNLIFIYSLIVIAVIDLQHQLIYNRILIVVLSIGVVMNLFFQVIPWKSSFFGMALSGGTLWLFAELGRFAFRKESLGMGDVKLGAVAGFFLGTKIILPALYAGFVLALIIIAGINLWKKQSNMHYIPMGPFLGASLIIFTLWGEKIIEFYLAMFV